MALPDPEPGLVIRYDYVWTHEATAGRDQGKDRPTCLVAATDKTVRPRYVVLLPITHTPPSGDTVGIEIPLKVKQAIGLDDEPSWVIVSEHNVDEWPNAGLSPVPGRPGEIQLWLYSADSLCQGQGHVSGSGQSQKERIRPSIISMK